MTDTAQKPVSAVYRPQYLGYYWITPGSIVRADPVWILMSV